MKHNGKPVTIIGLIRTEDRRKEIGDYFASQLTKLGFTVDSQYIEKARTQNLLVSPGHPYTEALLAGTSDPDANNAKTYKEIPPGEPPSLITPPSGCRFHPSCPYVIKGLCEVEVPPEFKLEPEHLAACWLHREREA